MKRKNSLIDVISGMKYELQYLGEEIANEIRNYFIDFKQDSVVRWATFSFLLSLFAVILKFIKYFG